MYHGHIGKRPRHVFTYIGNALFILFKPIYECCAESGLVENEVIYFCPFSQITTAIDSWDREKCIWSLPKCIFTNLHGFKKWVTLHHKCLQNFHFQTTFSKTKNKFRLAYCFCFLALFSFTHSTSKKLIGPKRYGSWAHHSYFLNCLQFWESFFRLSKQWK